MIKKVLVIGLIAAVGLSIWEVYNQQQRGRTAYERHQGMLGPHNPDAYRQPVCVSRDNPGWGVTVSDQGRWLLQQPDVADLTPIYGHWSRYPKLTNLACREST